MDFGRLARQGHGAITVGGHRADEHEGSHQCQCFFHAPVFRLPSSTTRSNAASMRWIPFPPAWAISGRSPPDPPISAAAGLMSSFAGKADVVEATMSVALASLTEPSTKIPDLCFSRSISTSDRKSLISNPSTCCQYTFGAPGTSTTVDRKSTRLNSSHGYISYAVFCLKKKNTIYRMCLAMEFFSNSDIQIMIY